MIQDLLLDAVHAALGARNVEQSAAIVVERPARPEHGDWSTNAALVSSKAAQMNPRQLAEQLVEDLGANPPAHVEAVEIAGPGFINFRLAPTWLHDVLRTVATMGEDGYARLDLGQGRSVNVEYVSANPTGPIHAGGGRWGAYGDSLARIFERCGHEVHREFYVNDRGVQAKLFGASLTAARDGEPTPQDGYLGEYIDQWASEMPLDVDPTRWGIDRSLRDASEVLESMHVVFDTWFSEAGLVAAGAVEETLAELDRSGHVYRHEGATWLRTTTFGDDKDRPLVRSDGEPTYFLPDIAYHRDKFNRGDLLIDVLGADHHGYAPRMKAALLALGHSAEDYEVIIGQNVKLLEGGVEVKMSKRAGTLVEIRDLIDAVGPDVARFAYLLQSIDSPQTLDLDVLRAQAADNPVYYVQYANARIHSIGREASKRGISRVDIDEADLSLLVDSHELDLIRHMSELPQILELAYRERAPHKITTWVRELASDFHSFYNHCLILRSDIDEDRRQARLWLAEASRVGLAIGLDLLGVNAPEEM